jgi:hypothetical protein
MMACVSFLNERPAASSEKVMMMSVSNLIFHELVMTEWFVVMHALGFVRGGKGEENGLCVKQVFFTTQLTLPGLSLQIFNDCSTIAP